MFPPQLGLFCGSVLNALQKLSVLLFLFSLYFLISQGVCYWISWHLGRTTNASINSIVIFQEVFVVDFFFFKHTELHFKSYPNMDKRTKTKLASCYLLNKCEGNVDVFPSWIPLPSGRGCCYGLQPFKFCAYQLFHALLMGFLHDVDFQSG